MKKKYLLLLILCLSLISCRSPQQRPLEEDHNNGQMETNQSSIFRVAPVQYCEIVVDSAEVKNGIGIDFNTIAKLQRNDVVKVLDEVGDRYVVQMKDNRIGSIDTNSAKPVIREDAPQQEPIVRKPEPTTPDADIIPPENDGNIADRFVPPDTLTPDDEPDLYRPTPQERETTPNVDDNTPQDRAEGPTGDIQSQALQMVDLVNQERAKNGLPTLSIDQEVARVAGIKSQDMVDQNYFSHYSPTYGSPFEMLDSFGVEYIVAGENLAGNSSVSAAHTALMNSSGHRQNILHPDFTHIGIGVRRSPRYGYVYTQMFIKK
ncbi:CAP domain-containing protein [Alkaliphilus hydrothermalis]|uniref:YkwD family protein n=1 Tax=Alkaliphilus hydrothermalis TaxID=1482730 RepID=A0ABS2NPZ5_9FIRM|nr:CAP domain-containing protein [Alkaliphilus hydrothermalis]MBM7614967.1 putative YkwD family protein [Alkaliphilus hydrothermalis]